MDELRADTVAESGARSPLSRDDLLTELARRYGSGLRALAFRRLGDHLLAEDVAQETFLRALQSARFDSRRPAWPWLSKIATNICIDLARTRTTSREIVSSTLDAHADSPAFGSDNLTDGLFARERTKTIASTLATLNGRHRTVLALRDGEGWSFEAIAEAQGTTIEAVKSVLKRSRANFRARYTATARQRGLLGALPVAGPFLAGVRRVRERVRGTGACPATSVALTVALVTAGVLPGPPHGGGTAMTKPSTVIGSPLPQQARAVTPPRTHRSAENATLQPTLLGFPDPRGNPTPYDSQVDTIVASPGYERDHTLFVSARQLVGTCPSCPILFRSADGGTTWERLAAVGFAGGRILLPPSYPVDPTMFAVGRVGLQRSDDGGHSFTTVVVAVPPVRSQGSDLLDQHVAAVIDPASPPGGARVLLGTSPLSIYDAANDTAGPGPILPLDMQRVDDVAYLGPGGPVQVAGVRGTFSRRSILRCDPTLCGVVAEGWDGGAMLTNSLSRILVSPSGAAVYIYNADSIVSSHDGGRSFTLTFVGPTNHIDLVSLSLSSDFARSGTIVLRVNQQTLAGRAPVETYRSSDDGYTLEPVRGEPIPMTLVPLLSLPDGRVFTAWGSGYATRGLACSRDGLRTWNPSCG